MRKKRILYHSNHSKAFTGFGKNAKNILKHLFNTDKYEIFELANGISYGHPELDKRPWKTLGSMPNNQARINELNKDPNLARKAGYGHEIIDQAIKECKPDLYIGAEDIWAFDGFWDKKWWNKMNCMIWTTLDSLPILPIAEKNASKIKNYYTWAKFAEEALVEAGHKHVKTLRGSIDTSTFFRLGDEERLKIRNSFGIDKNDFIIGFVFRNQLRKSVPNILEGFKLFKQKNPNLSTKLLLHTHWGEGWDIPRLIKEKSINNSDILTTYFCPKCGEYEIKPFVGQDQDCQFCNSKKSQKTTNIAAGVDEDQLNQVYNLMDVYCHPFTSGGQEIPIQEAKLTELITLVTNYSCGKDCCTKESGGIPLSWSEYREPGTQFIKASTHPTSICEELCRVLKMNPEKRKALGEKSRKFVIDNYGTDVIGSKLEKIIDEMPYCEWDFDFSEKLRNPNYTPPPIENDSEWLKDLYKNILTMDVLDDDDGLKYWLKELDKGASRNDVLAYFKKVACDENNKNQKTDLEDLLDKNDSGKRLLYVMPQSAGDLFMSTALFPSIKRVYPDYNLYVATDPKFFPILDGNKNIHKILPFVNGMDDLLAMEGRGNHKGYFEIAFLPYIGTQKIFNYQHNGKDKIEFELCT